MHDVVEMPERLARFLTERDGSRSAQVVSYEAMVGGYSRLMAKAEVVWSDGLHETLVLRGDPPPGRAMIETSRDTEYALLRALTDAGSIAIPAVRHYDAAGEHFGTKCIVVDYRALELHRRLHRAESQEGRLMLSRPTTDQILADCRHELLNVIDAAVTDPAAKIAIQMMENVLRNCAARAAHEIAWMTAEAETMIAFAERVAASPSSTDVLSTALEAYRSQRSGSLHLDDVSATYGLAGECLSMALEAALAASDDDLHSAGREVLEQRLAHELDIMGEWTMVGRG